MGKRALIIRFQRRLAMAKGKPSRKSTIPVDRNGSKAPAGSGPNIPKNTNVKRIPRHQGR